MRLPNKMEKAAARLREWRWKLVNFVAVFKTKLSPDKQLPGYDDLDEIVAAYCKWRDVHIQKAATAQLAAVPTLRGNSVTVGDRVANSESTGRPVRWIGWRSGLKTRTAFSSFAAAGDAWSKPMWNSLADLKTFEA
jgi:hypothetical protein